jgi:CpXC protein
MSLFHSETVSCPSCGAALRIEFADSVSADRRPDLRQEILDDSFQSVTCEACGTRARLSPSLTYLDAARRQWMLTLPATNRPYWDSFERGALAIFADSFGADSPVRIQELGQALATRVVFGWSGLREKLLCQQLGVSDADLELLKLLLMRTVASGGVADTTSLRLLGEGEDGTLRIGWVDDETEAVRKELHAPRTLLDEIKADGPAWDGVRAEITSGPFVDVTKLLVEPELPLAE